MNILRQWHIGGMKIKTSVKRPTEVRDRDQRDLRTINRLSGKLNSEAEDALDYQRQLHS